MVVGYTRSYGVTIVNLHTRQVGKTIFFPEAPLQVVYSANSQTAYVLTTQSDTGMVYVIDMHTGKVLASQSTLGFAHDIALGLNGKVLLIDTHQSPTIQALALPSLAPEKSVTMPGDAGLGEEVTTDGTTDWFLAENYGTGNGEELTPLNIKTLEPGKAIFITNTAGQILLRPDDKSAVLVGENTSVYLGGVATVVTLDSGAQRSVDFGDWSFGIGFIDNHGRDLYVETNQSFGAEEINLVTGTLGPPITIEPEGSAYTVAGFAQTPSKNPYL